MVSTTSCTRRIAAPRDRANRPAASEPAGGAGIGFAGDRRQGMTCGRHPPGSGQPRERSSGRRRRSSMRLLGRLGEADTGVDDDPVPRDAGAPGRFDPLSKLPHYVRRHVIVVAPGHTYRPACRACASARPDSPRPATSGAASGIKRESRDVVDDGGAGIERRRHRGGVAGVHGDPHAAAARPRITGRMRRCSSVWWRRLRVAGACSRRPHR